MLGLINVCAHAYVPFYVVSPRSAYFFVSLPAVGLYMAQGLPGGQEIW